MGYSVKILLDSMNSAGDRLTTFELTYPRFVHAELLTHRLMSRNSASSRAIPVSTFIERITNDPAFPTFWGKNQSGMQANEELSIEDQEKAKELWLEARDKMIEVVLKFKDLGLHKQIANRIIEPWMYITVIVSSTTYENWFKLRDHKDAQPEIAKLAKMMKEVYDNSEPQFLEEGFWHMPFITNDDYLAIKNDINLNTEGEVINYLKKVSVGRCARVSYLTHDGKRDLSKDIELHDRLISGLKTGDPLHLSPLEHVAMAMPDSKTSNFWGWHQYRKDIMDSDKE